MFALMEAWDWREHLTLILAIASTAIVVVRLLSVAAYDTQTALGIIHATGTGSALIGTAISLAGLLSVLSMVTVAAVFLVNRPRGRVARNLLTVLFAALALISFFMSQLLAFLFAMAVTMTIMTTVLYRILEDMRRVARNEVGGNETRAPKKRRSARHKIPLWRRVISGLAMGVTGLYVATVVLSGEPWVPSERLEIIGEPPVTGYVLAVTGDTVTILLHQPRELRYYKPSAIRARALCTSVPPFVRTVFSSPARVLEISLILEGPRYVECPGYYKP